ncbi:dehydrogenase with different specificitie [Aspergillus bertholletiae]|uniref:Dehydrogenase with different specificitie n=1 Tax=Aspergillus bertholletiae TaxID=1226010 RepID=A0A5N7ARA5_9EURO|nr:dehydrogenase with different specificitie [Aspergillus bertholletiae]
MQRISLDQSLVSQESGKVVLITGSANGIGAATALLFNAHSAKIIISDLEICQNAAENLIQEFPRPENALFVAADILDWQQMTALFKTAAGHFGALDIVIANAGTMESMPILDLNDIDGDGNLKESTEGFQLIDINIKGTLNTLRLALHHMKSKQPSSGSIVLIASTSGYFGGTGVTAYVTSKHGIVGLLRASQGVAQQYGIRVNAVAPFFTPTRLTAGFACRWVEAGLEANTPQHVADTIAYVAMDEGRHRSSILVAGRYLRELEPTKMGLVPRWVGEDVAEFMARAMRFFTNIGGYVLPKFQ